MLLSLVSAPVLGFDLTRHPHGDAIAAVLLRALTCGPRELASYAQAQDRVDTVALAEARLQVRLAIDESLAVGPRTNGRRRAALSLDEVAEQLRVRMISDLDSVEALVREDVFAWCARAAEDDGAEPVPEATVRIAADVFIDAIASVWPREGLSPAPRRVLVAAFLDGSRQVPWREPDVGPNGDAIRADLARLSALDAYDRDRMRAVVRVLRPTSTTQWAAAMHEASWAALTTGRIRAAAAAQLLAVRSYSASGFDALDGADGVWNAISGHVHARVMADVLPDHVTERLSRTWQVVFGED